MPFEDYLNQLPEYGAFMESIAALQLPFSPSELHGVMCGYLCAGTNDKAEVYLRTLCGERKSAAVKKAFLALFAVYTLSQQQIDTFDFEFQLLLPNDNESLLTRAQAFSEWCTGFSQGMTSSGVHPEQFNEEDTQDMLHHLQEFAKLDVDALEMGETDEKSFMEVTEYARMAVLTLHGEVKARSTEGSKNGRQTH